MLLVGNDIVDLRHAGCVGKAGHPRFVERVFCAEEQAVIRNSSDPDRVLWLHWAAKEAAYKIACKLLPRPVFAHSRFRVAIDGSVSDCAPGCRCRQTLSARVVYGSVVVALRVFLSHSFVHAYGTADAGPDALRSVHAGLASQSSTASTPLQELTVSFSAAEMNSILSTESALVRLRAKADLARHLGLLPERLQIIRPGAKGDRQPPQLLLDGRPADVDLSLSHHGAFVAWAFASTRQDGHEPVLQDA